MTLSTEAETENIQQTEIIEGTVAFTTLHMGYIFGDNNVKYVYRQLNGRVRGDCEDRTFLPTKERVFPRPGDRVFFVPKPPVSVGQDPVASPWAFVVKRKRPR